jgi:hypothetical protein
MEILRGATKVEVFGDRDEAAQLGQIKVTDAAIVSAGIQRVQLTGDQRL